MEILELLQASPLFSSLGKRILFRIAGLSQKIHFKKNDYLMHEGEKGESCYIIDEGLVQVFREKNGSEKLIITQLGKGEIVGELSLLDGMPRSASVIALQPTDTFAISEWDFKAQLQAYPEIALQLLPVVSKRLRQTLDQLAKRNT